MPNGKKIKKIMLERDMSQVELSRKSGVKKDYLNSIIRNNRNVTENVLARLCKVLKCDPKDIMLTIEELDERKDNVS